MDFFEERRGAIALDSPTLIGALVTVTFRKQRMTELEKAIALFTQRL